MEIIRFIVWCINLFLVIRLVFCGQKETQSTWAWILLLLNLPLVGLCLYFLTGQGVQKEEQGNVRDNPESVTEDNQVRILIHGEEKFRVLFEDLLKAKREILIQYYIYRDDFLLKNMSQILCEKAAQGVNIKLIYDTLVSRKIKKRFW